MSEELPGGQLVPRRHRGREQSDGPSALSLEDLLRHSKVRIDRKEFRAALPLLQQALDGAPHHVPALMMTAYCHLSLRDAVQALEFARQACRQATGAQIGAARAVYQECAHAASDDQLEALRSALREGKLGRAATLADQIVEARPDDDGVANVHAYVYERLLSAPSPAARARGRTGRAPVRSMTPQALQATLTWLARDELEEGAAALDAGDFVRAAGVLDRINRIDDRGARAGYLQARAMYNSVVTKMATPAPGGLAAAAENLRRATGLAQRAAAVEEFAARARMLLNEIDALNQRVTAELAVRPVSEPFKALQKRYLGRMITYFEASAFRRSLASLRVEAEKAERGCQPGSLAAQRLARIRMEIIHLQRQLPYV